MPFTNSARGQLTAVIPTGPTSPAVVSHLTTIVNAIEPRMVLRAATVAAASTGLGTLENGMLLVTTSAPYELHIRANNAWVKVYPTNYSGTAVPVASNYAEGDTYDRYV